MLTSSLVKFDEIIFKLILAFDGFDWGGAGVDLLKPRWEEYR